MNKFDKENKTGVNHTGVNPNYPTRLLTATSIIGDKVVSPEGENLGSIKDIMIDIQFGKIEYVVIELGGFLGIREKFFAIPFSHLKLDSKNEQFVLNHPKEIIEKAPGFDKDHWPETNTQMFESSGTYWGGFMGTNTGTPY
jgi:sporulation protein YlmC with PRC-barrel domain